MDRNILVLDSSIQGAASHSSALIDFFLEQVSGTVTRYSLGEKPFPMLDGETFEGFSLVSGGTEVQERARTLSDRLISELKAADVVVVGAPMYNFSVPVQLRTWFDYVMRVGATFRFSESGPEGLVEKTKALVISTRGGIHSDTDFAVPLVKTSLGLMGITDVTTVIAEGIAYGPEVAMAALSSAQEQLTEIAQSL